MIEFKITMEQIIGLLRGKELNYTFVDFANCTDHNLRIHPPQKGVFLPPEDQFKFVHRYLGKKES